MYILKQQNSRKAGYMVVVYVDIVQSRVFGKYIKTVHFYWTHV